MKKYDIPFEKKYKESKSVSLILIFVGLVFIIITITSEWLPISPIILFWGGLNIFYGIAYFLIYWKYAKYLKNNQKISKHLKIIAATFFIFYLVSHYQENQEEKQKYRFFLILREIRFTVFSILFYTMIITLILIFVKNWDVYYWVGLGVSILFLFLEIISIFFTIKIWKYQGVENKLLKILIIITLNYGNYSLYKKIIELNKGNII